MKRVYKTTAGVKAINEQIDQYVTAMHHDGRTLEKLTVKKFAYSAIVEDRIKQRDFKVYRALPLPIVLHGDYLVTF